jgi:hypothetical protein
MKLQHVVLFGFAESADARAISEVARHFALLQTLVPDIDAFEWGENCSPEGLHNGHTHAFVLTFGSTEARDAYLIHPDHIAFADWVKPFVASVTVFDYWAMAAAPAGSIQV